MPFCFYSGGALGNHRKVFLARERTLRLIDEAAELGIKAITWTGGGEPTLHPDFPFFVDHAAARGLRQGLFTNCLALPVYSTSRLDWIRVTVTDKPMRPDYIKMLRPCPTVGIAFNYAGPQDDDLLRHALAVGEEAGVTYLQLRPALAFHGQTVDITPSAISHPLLQVTEYKFAEAKKKHGYATCEAYHFVPFVWETGEIAICAYMRKYDGYMLGDLYKDSLKDILDRAPQSVPVLPTCQACCKLHELNRSIHESRSLKEVAFP